MDPFLRKSANNDGNTHLIITGRRSIIDRDHRRPSTRDFLDTRIALLDPSQRSQRRYSHSFLLLDFFVFDAVMVALLPALSIGAASMLITAFVLYPRLPQYSFRIQSAGPRWYGWEHGFRARLGSKVRLKNENNLGIDIHALSFDLFYPDWEGNLHWLGNVQDTQQLELMLQNEQALAEGSSSGPLPVPPKKPSAIWKMPARNFFETEDEVFLLPTLAPFRVMSRLFWDLWTARGILTIRSTGAVHIKANGQLPFTLNILCDNLLDTWALEMQGVHCDLDVMDLGWKNMTRAMEKLRLKIEQMPILAAGSGGDNEL